MEKFIYTTLFLVVMLMTGMVQAQVGINEDNTQPDASALLDVKSTTKGMLVPRMTTTQRNLISSPATGLLVFDTTTGSFWFYNGSWTDLSSSLSDADNDTKIQVEESGDEDKIRFDMAGTEHFTMSAGRLEVLNTGSSVFIGEGAGANDDLSNNNNTFVGYQAGNTNTTGSYNTANGYQALYFNTTGYYNTANGSSALKANTTGVFNTAYGFESGYNNQSGDLNVFLGNRAGFYETGSEKLYIDNSDTSTPLIWGDFSTDILRVNGTLNVNNAFSFPTADGTNGQVLVTDGSGALAWGNAGSGTQTLITDADNDTKIQVEESGDEDKIRFDLEGSERLVIEKGFSGATLLNLPNNNNNTFLGNNAGVSNTTGGNNIILGNEAGLLNQTGGNNVFSGYRAGFSNTAGGNNVFLGNEAGLLNQTGGNNVFLGNQAGSTETSSNKLYIDNSSTSTPLIYGEFDNNLLRINGTLNVNNAFSFPTADGTNGQVLTTNGSGGLTWNNSTNTDDQTIDVLNLNGTSLEISLEGDGQATQSLDLSSINTDTDDQTIDVLNLNGTTLEISLEGDGQATQTLDISSINSVQTIVADADNDTKIQVEESGDEDKIRFDMAGTEYFRMSAGRLEVLNTGNSVFIGEGAGVNDDLSSNQNTFIGYEAGQFNTTGEGNVFTGFKAGLFNTTGIQNVFSGSYAGNSNTTGGYNVFTGFKAGDSNTTGSQNVFSGFQAGSFNTTGFANVFSGFQAGNSNTTGFNNVISGSYAGYLNTTGNNNVFLGNRAGYNETGSDKLYIDNSDTSTPLIWGDFSTNRAGINRVATTNTLEVGGNASKASAGDWLANSDARLKKNITPLSSEKMLNNLLALQGVTYEWNDDKTGNIRPEGIQYGFTAQNIEAVFPTLVDEDNTGYLQTAYGTYDAMTIEAIRALNDKITAFEKGNIDLSVQVQSLEEENEALKAQAVKINQLETMMAELQSQIQGNTEAYNSEN